MLGIATKPSHWYQRKRKTIQIGAFPLACHIDGVPEVSRTLKMFAGRRDVFAAYNMLFRWPTTGNDERRKSASAALQPTGGASICGHFVGKTKYGCSHGYRHTLTHMGSQPNPPTRNNVSRSSLDFLPKRKSYSAGDSASNGERLP